MTTLDTAPPGVVRPLALEGRGAANRSRSDRRGPRHGALPRRTPRRVRARSPEPLPIRRATRPLIGALPFHRGRLRRRIHARHSSRRNERPPLEPDRSRAGLDQVSMCDRRRATYRRHGSSAVGQPITARPFVGHLTQRHVGVTPDRMRSRSTSGQAAPPSLDPSTTPVACFPCADPVQRRPGQDRGARAGPGCGERWSGPHRVRRPGRLPSSDSEPAVAGSRFEGGYRVRR